ncbi:GTP-binding protein [Clostridium estertheticum]|uniref:GTP-binding protein n=1 Tax=Clostridium estertheticum TaxID=238834 RepID=UPI0013E9510A|nr:GTP-binding protein [Clostridium estertheticum]MBZ9686182.1 GTP-binding protein [Clostridium estertheticum]
MIKIDVVSGFLGSGKTTLIKSLLKAYENEKVVLIENEFGDIGIDGDIIEREGFQVFEISSGCICCIMKKDFLMVLSRIISEFNPDRIIVEPTGISILSEIIDILSTKEVSEKCSINSLVTVIDSINYLQQCDVFGEFFEDQIINAETLILSKSQFIDQEKVEEITEALRKLNKESEIITSNWSNLSSSEVKELLEGNIKLDLKELFYAEYKPCKENKFKAVGIKTSKKFTKRELEEILMELKNPIYGMVLRGKGFLKGVNSFLEFSYTNGEYIIDENKERCSGRLCLIGQNLNEEELNKLFKIKVGGLFHWLKF